MSARAAFALAYCLAGSLLLFACAPACPAPAKAAIAADWLAGVRVACKGFGSLAECPAADRLKADRLKAELAAGCR